MPVTILCAGDVVGQPGRFALSQALPELVTEHNVDCTIVNVENAAGGSGLTPPLHEKFLRYGVDLMTMGDHIYKKRDIIPVLERSDRIVRPANFPPAAVGREYAVHVTDSGVPVAVISVLGRLYMRPPTDCPYRAVDRVLQLIPPDVRVVVVDMHAEATSEKIAMGWYLDGRVSIVFGTHTHVATADEVILPQGTAYITDVGMTGPHESVLGRRVDRVLQMMTTSLPVTLDVATGQPRVSGIIVEVDEQTGKATSIRRIRVDAEKPNDTQQKQS